MPFEQTQALDHHVILPRDHAEIRITSDDKETTATFRDRRWVFPNEDCVILPVINTTAEEIARVIAERAIEQNARKVWSKPVISGGCSGRELRAMGSLPPAMAERGPYER